MNAILYILKSDVWLVISNLMLLYAVAQILVNKYIVVQHDEKTKYAVPVISGGDGNRERWEKEQESYRYMRTKRYKFIERLRKIF